MQVYYNGIYSIDITIGNNTYNTWNDLHLIPEERPIIMPPEPNIVIEDVPNDYFIDLSTGGNDNISFGNRTGTWNFIVDYNGWNSWSEAYNFILNNIHGKKARIKLNNYDDINYVGYLEISSYSSEEECSKISLTYYIMDNTIRNDRFPESIIEDYDEELPIDAYPPLPGPVLIDTDIIDYQEGPNSNFSLYSGLDIEYDDVGPELPDELSPVQYSVDPEPYSEDGWVLSKNGYFELSNLVNLDENHDAYLNVNDTVILKSIKENTSDYGIEYRIHLYTNNPIEYNRIIYNNYDASLENMNYDSGIQYHSKKFEECYKMYTDNITTFTLNEWIYIKPCLRIEKDLYPILSSFSYFIYINTANTAVAVPGQDKFSINFNANPESSLYNDEYDLVKSVHGLPLLTKVTSTNAFDGNNYMSIRDSAFKLDKNGVDGDITIQLIIIHNSTNVPKLLEIYPTTYHGDTLQYYISELSHYSTVQRDFYTIDVYGWSGGYDTIILPIFDFDSDDKNLEYTYFLYINTNVTQLVEYNNADFKWYDNTQYMFFSDIKAVPNTGYPNYTDYQLIKYGYDAPDIQRYTTNNFISYAISNSVFKLKSKNEDGKIKFYVRIYTSNNNLNSSNNESYIVTTYEYAFPTSNHRYTYRFSISSQDNDYSYGFCSKTITIDTQNYPIWYFDIQTSVRNTRNIEDIAPFSYFIYIDPSTTEVAED